jgi:squalene cyclase
MAFGLSFRHPSMRGGVEYLLSQQNPDGSWGDPEGDVYTRYHTTWAVVDGLREYNWRGERLKFPRLKPLLERWAE